MDKKEREQRFDGILFSLAEQHPQGVIDVKITFKSLFLFAILIFAFHLATSNDCRIFSPKNRFLHWW
jgi:hypothetical protein